jgi:CRP-like cAMP-binding protein
MSHNDSSAGATNRILSALPPEELQRLQPHLEYVELPLKQILFDPGIPISYLYFPSDGVCSILTPTEDGPFLEIGLIGNEGVVGHFLYLGQPNPSYRAIIQIPVSAQRIRADRFLEVVPHTPTLQRLLLHHTQAFFNQVAQVSACNHYHPVEERLCRWLLQIGDRVGSDRFTMTHEFMAQMLGVRRPTVTLVAGTLQMAGFIQYSRGQIEIMDREGLEASTCGCYDKIRLEEAKLLPHPVSSEER